jgi:hypothetical protein
MKKRSGQRLPNSYAAKHGASSALDEALAATPFAMIQPDGTLPTTNFTPPPLTAGWEMIMALSWTASISYTSNGRNDQSGQFSGMSDLWSPIPVDFQGIVQGGTISLAISASVRDIVTGATDIVKWNGTSIIGGLNPSTANVKTRLGDLPSQVAAYKESRFAQFDASNFPKVGTPQGFGIMQLDNSPPATSQQIWVWMQNVDAGKSKFASGAGTISQHYANLIAANPNLPTLDAPSLKVATYQYYNTGNKGFYWVPNATGDDWIKNPTLAYTAYGDDAARIEGLVTNGTPPSDW